MNGVFIEPQAQLSLGHINSTDYTTKNGTKVRYDDIDSAVAVSYTHLDVYKRQAS